jgi:16S rRNA (guanine527-N7)-methyltransferase
LALFLSKIVIMDAAVDFDDRQEFREALQLATKGMGLSLTDAQQDAMLAHFGLMSEANRHFNLTRITSPTDAAVKHYADSLAILRAPWLDQERSLKVLDVGTGAGFPAVPLAIMRPDWQVTAIDGTRKKVRFVEETGQALKLQNLHAQHVRAADYPHKAEFDLVLLRAVGALEASMNEAWRLVAAGGAIAFYKTASLALRELELGNRRASSLAFKPLKPLLLTITGPEEHLHRQIVAYRR